LTGIGGIRQYFLVSRHRRIKDNLTNGGSVSTYRLAFENTAILKGQNGWITQAYLPLQGFSLCDNPKKSEMKVSSSRFLLSCFALAYTDLFCPERLPLNTLILGARFYGIARWVSTEYMGKALALIVKTPMILVCKTLEHDQHVSEGTRDKLLLTAMHLYARQGIHEVSLRAISSAAGSRNSAAMHYHFQNKLGVLDALAGFIFHHLNEIAAQQQLYRRAQCSQDIGQSIKLCLLPIIEMADRYPWGNDAIRFLSRLLAESKEEFSTITIRHNHKFYQAADLFLAGLLPQLDKQTRQLRIMFMAVNIFHGFAEIASLQRTPLGDLSQIDRDSLINQLVSYLAGGLQAPMNSTMHPPTGDTHERSAL